jgi:hypothetical protein
MGGCPTGKVPGGFHRGRRKKGLQTNLQNEIVQEIENLLGRQSIAELDLEAVEMAARRQALRLAARALEERLNTDTSDHVGPELPCPCGGSAKYHGRHGKTFESVLGPLHLQRSYYHCEQCESGFCPRDRALKLELFSLTPGVLRMTTSAAALVSFEESSGLLHELAGVQVSAKQVERAAEALGAEIAVDEQQQVEKMGEVAPTAPTMYLGMDGTGVPMRTQEVKDCAGKQADGSAKTREAKLVTIWTAESRDEEGQPVRDPGSITYSAAIESAATLDTSPDLSDFAARVQREASRRGFTEAQRQAVLGDGSAWIWNTASELFPQATQILDRFHAKEHLSQVGKVIYGDSPEGKQWIQTRYDELDQGRLKSLVHALHGHAGQYKEARECIHYIWKNRLRMRYPKFQQQGFCTSTGVVEAGCKVVIGTRLKRAGMHWTVKGANAIIALRCSKLSGRFEGFWERRSEQKQAAA